MDKGETHATGCCIVFALSRRKDIAIISHCCCFFVFFFFFFSFSEIRKLISEIIKASAADSSSGSSSSPSVLYGSLFESTQNSMEALSGTLMTAKRRGVVSYDGSLLLQRVHDQVRITLLKREIPDSPLPDHSKRKAPPIKPDAFATAKIIGIEKCVKCHKVSRADGVMAAQTAPRAFLPCAPWSVSAVTTRCRSCP